MTDKLPDMRELLGCGGVAFGCARNDFHSCSLDGKGRFPCEVPLMISRGNVPFLFILPSRSLPHSIIHSSTDSSTHPSAVCCDMM